MYLPSTTASRLGRVRDHVRSVLSARTDASASTAGNRGPETAETTTESDDDGPGNLFHCSRCGVVYIAEEKHVCSQCDSDVEQVPSTLSCR